ncbi:MAG: hypothetical protein IPI65_08355 [Bacteroidetes bacterium]|nr:hypothetical protein [Bacteroidota bacterium]
MFSFFSPRIGLFDCARMGNLSNQMNTLLSSPPWIVISNQKMDYDLGDEVVGN